MSLRGLLCVTVALGGATTAASVVAAPTAYVRTSHVAASLRIPAGRSVGSPTDGRLVGGAHLETSPYLRIVPVYEAGDVRWGLGSLVLLIDDAARAVRRQYPDAVMSVGHLSKRGGGDIDRHASHESGRDADVGFYIRSQTGKPLYSDHFVPFRGDGTAPSWPGAYFDDARNWTLVSSLVTGARARITYLFVATPIRTRLLAYAERAGVPLAVRSRAAELMMQPRGSMPHDDHFHVRIACPPDSRGCIELPSMARRRSPHGVAAHPPAAAGPRDVPPTNPAPSAPASGGPPHDAGPDPEDTVAPPERAPSGTDAPPAVLGVPIDDVDGPVTTHRRRTPLP